MFNKKRLLVTGCAGFIGMHLCKRLLEDGYEIYGIDNLNDYYDPKLKYDRLEILSQNKMFKFDKIDISDYETLFSVFSKVKPHKVVNLAAQAGVRHSIEDPHTYIKSNVNGFLNILECCRYNKVKNLIYASSSSVYGDNKKIPFSINDKVDNPISIYAVTKRSNELMAHSYNYLYGLSSTGLRFFTVYGPWGRPDMAISIFTKNILEKNTFSVFNHGNLSRDFTYIEDIIDGIILSINHNYTFEIFNLGNNKPVNLMDVLKILENNLGQKAKIKFSDLQLGDVKDTSADIEYSKEKLGYNPKTSIDKGLKKFIDWYQSYNKR